MKATFKAGDRVRVVKASGGRFWYSNKVGETFTLTGETRESSLGLSYYIKDSTAYLLSDDIELVKDKDIEVIFNPTQVRSAAEYIAYDSNSTHKSVMEVEQEIYQNIKDGVCGDMVSITKKGYLIVFTKENETTTVVTVWVAPPLNTRDNYFQTTLKDGKLIVEF